MLEKLLRSNAEVAVLGVALFSERLHLREIARRAGISPSEAKRELDSLTNLGVLTKAASGNQVIYMPNPLCPFISELKGLYLKTEGPIPLLKKGLSSIAGIKYAFVYGSFASGDFSERSDLDLFLVGNILAKDVDSVCFDAQKKTLREINYILWTEDEFEKKMKERGAFAASLVKKKRIWMIGNEAKFSQRVKFQR